MPDVLQVQFFREFVCHQHIENTNNVPTSSHLSREEHIQLKNLTPLVLAVFHDRVDRLIYLNSKSLAKALNWNINHRLYLLSELSITIRAELCRKMQKYRKWRPKHNPLYISPSSFVLIANILTAIFPKRTASLSYQVYCCKHISLPTCFFYF